MIESIFVILLDDYQGFLVEKRFPLTLSLNEKILNTIYYNHEKGKKEDVSFTEIDNLRILTFSSHNHPGHLVCFCLQRTTSPEDILEVSKGMSRLILELVKLDPEIVDLGEILKKKSILPLPNEEQIVAESFVTPSTALVLEKLQKEAVQTAAQLALWLKKEVQSDNVDIREAMRPLIRAGIVKVELVGKTKETVFLIKDVFGYREPPVNSIKKTEELDLSIREQYREYVKTFFSPPPPNKGYNPTIPVDDPNSPIVEDRERIARVLTGALNYQVLDCLRDQPRTIEQISTITSLPKGAITKSLWELQDNRITAYFEHDKLWALLTDPRMDTFMPEYVLDIVSRKIVDKELTPQTAGRYLDLLVENWSD